MSILANLLAKLEEKRAQQAPPSTMTPAQNPMGMQAFQAMLPALFGNANAFSGPQAMGWLQQLFQQHPGLPQAQPGVQPFQSPYGAHGGLTQAPFMQSPLANGPMALGLPGGAGPKGFTPWNTVSKPGPAPDPFAGLRALSGPFGNGGGAIAPSFNRGLGSRRFF